MPRPHPRQHLFKQISLNSLVFKVSIRKAQGTKDRAVSFAGYLTSVTKGTVANDIVAIFIVYFLAIS